LDLEAVFDYAPFVRFADVIVGRLDEIAPAVLSESRETPAATR
jgi:hypothetical protein